MASTPLHITVDRLKGKVDRALSEAEGALGHLTSVELPANVRTMAHEMWEQIEGMRRRLRKRPSR